VNYRRASTRRHVGREKNKRLKRPLDALCFNYLIILDFSLDGNWKDRQHVGRRTSTRRHVDTLKIQTTVVRFNYLIILNLFTLSNSLLAVHSSRPTASFSRPTPDVSTPDGRSRYNKKCSISI
jgi:hypothetical protein